MKSQEQIQVWSLLSKAKNYRGFMQSYVDWMKTKKPGYGYASLGRQAGFAARSYPRDVIRGQRSLTLASISRFAEAMNLTGEAARCFFLLVCLERPDFYRGRQDENISELLKGSLSKLTKQIENRTKSSTQVFNRSSWPVVYASLGTGSGASLAEICARSHLPERSCAETLNRMIEEKLVLYDKKRSRYFSHTSHLVCEDLGENEGFRNFFLSSLRRAEAKAKRDFKKTDRLFFSSAITVKRSELRSYRNKLRDLLNTFSETSETPAGDDVVTIVCGLFPQGD